MARSPTQPPLVYFGQCAIYFNPAIAFWLMTDCGLVNFTFGRHAVALLIVDRGARRRL